MLYLSEKDLVMKIKWYLMKKVDRIIIIHSLVKI